MVNSGALQSPAPDMLAARTTGRDEPVPYESRLAPQNRHDFLAYR